MDVEVGDLYKNSEDRYLLIINNNQFMVLLRNRPWKALDIYSIHKYNWRHWAKVG
jgi:hypothetical protein